MSCSVCGRARRGYGFQPPRPDVFADLPPRQFACSMICLEILYRKAGKVFSLNHFENQAIDAASEQAGGYLERIGKTDLSTLSAEEWLAFLQIVFVTATSTIQRLSNDQAVPF